MTVHQNDEMQNSKFNNLSYIICDWACKKGHICTNYTCLENSTILGYRLAMINTFSVLYMLFY